MLEIFRDLVYKISTNNTESNTTPHTHMHPPNRHDNNYAERGSPLSPPLSLSLVDLTVMQPTADRYTSWARTSITLRSSRTSSMQMDAMPQMHDSSCRQLLKRWADECRRTNRCRGERGEGGKGGR